MNHMPTNSMRTKRFRYFYAATLIIVAWAGLAGQAISVADAGQVVFLFQAELRGEAQTYGIPKGQQVSGSYTFELGTPLNPPLDDNNHSWYSDVVTDFTVSVPGFGTGHGNDGDIVIGAPVQTEGGYSYLSDWYLVLASASGITLSGPDGDMYMCDATIQLQDIDMEGLDSENLSATPPDLAFFTDTTGPTPDTTDEAKLFLVFNYPTGGFRSIPFELTSLTAVPEPGTGCLSVLAAITLLGCYRIRRGSSQR